MILQDWKAQNGYPVLLKSLANNEDPDEIMHNAAFHQGLHCLLRQNRSSKIEV